MAEQTKAVTTYAYQVKLYTLDTQNPAWHTVDEVWFYRLARRLGIGEATMARAFARGEMIGAYSVGASYYLRRMKAK